MRKISKTKALENKVLRYEQEFYELSYTLDQLSSALMLIRSYMEKQEYHCFNECQSINLVTSKLIDKWLDVNQLLEESEQDDE